MKDSEYLEGVVASVVAGRGFGFISSPGIPDTFFHVRDLTPGLEFNEQLQGRRVRFNVEPDEKGVRARRVEPVD